jgi:hypothetical protein
MPLQSFQQQLSVYIESSQIGIRNATKQNILFGGIFWTAGCQTSRRISFDPGEC